MPSDYLTDLVEHKRLVAQYLQVIADDLFRRAAVHDNSKFSPEEYEAYEEAFPGLQKYAYGTEEFKAELAKIQPTITLHYRVNDHHPEHFPDGISGMNLIQIIEMACDWLAASHRSQTSFAKGLDINKQRFGIDDQLFGSIKATIEHYYGHFLLVEPPQPGRLDGIASAEREQV